MPKKVEFTEISFLRACEILESEQNLQNVHNAHHSNFFGSFQQWGGLEKIEWLSLRKAAGHFNKASENRFKTLDGLFLTPNSETPKVETPNLGDLLGVGVGNSETPKVETPNLGDLLGVGVGNSETPKVETPKVGKKAHAIKVETPKVETKVAKKAAEINAILARQIAINELCVLNRWKDLEKLDFSKLRDTIITAITPIENFEDRIFEGFNLLPTHAMIKLASKSSPIYYGDDAARVYSLVLWNLVMSEEALAENRVAIALNIGLCMVANTESHVEKIFKDLCSIHCAVFGAVLTEYEKTELTGFKSAVARALHETGALAKRNTEMFEPIESKWLQF